MPNQLINEEIRRLRNQLAIILSGLRDLARRCGLEREAQIAADALPLINSPFLFVIVGEVKAGKSRFVNALLGVEICKEAPEPCTDSIQEITHSETETVDVLGENRKRIGHPVELLKSITIVDTPGTNSIIRRHEVITKEYIPHSDLVVFVFPAKNPHTGSAWDLLEYVGQEWRRKIIFVLQQIDLEREHLAAQVESVRAYALKHGVTSPIIFATSARWEQEGKTELSGFATVREYIRQKVTGGRHLIEKLESQVSTARTIFDTTKRSMEADRTQVEADRKIQKRIKDRLGFGENRSAKEIEALISRLLTAYESITAEFKTEFRAGLEFWTVMSRSFHFVTRAETIEQWLKGLQKRFEEKLQRRLDQISVEEAASFVEGVRLMMIDLVDQLGKVTSSRESLQAASRVDDTRAAIVEGIKAHLDQLTNDMEPLVNSLSDSVRKLRGEVAGGGLLAMIGTIIACIVKVAILDITGGVLTALGLSVVGIALLWRRGKLISDFDRGLDQGRAQLKAVLSDKLNANLRGIYREVERVFTKFYDHVAERERELTPKLEKLEKVGKELLETANQIARLADDDRGAHP
jgi:ribosome biogenesis GTPase A/phage host-nuclease inhibitor protein Gam